jgi:DNA-3-methyladenine glycosylase II
VQHAIDHLKNVDPVLATIIERIGPCTITYREPVFETLVRSIVFQQLNGRAAMTIFNRLAEAVGGTLTPESILKLSTPKLRAVGLSKQKMAYIRDLAKLTAAGDLDFAALRELPDEEVIAALTKVKGVGVWTAHMFLLFALRRENVLPTGDLGVRAALRRAYKKRKLPSPMQIEKMARTWHPYCSIATWYLWRYAELPTLGEGR